MGKGWVSRGFASTGALAVATLSFMCGPPSPPPIRVTPTTLNATGNETSAAYSRSRVVVESNGHIVFVPGTLLVQFNNGVGHNLVASSTNGGVNWHVCDAPAIAPNGCGPGGGPVPVALGDLVLLQATRWRGDPNIAASADGRTVVMSNLADTSDQGSNPAKPNGIVVSTSLDGGHTFINSDFANAPLSLLADCRLGAAVDQQSLTADATVPNRYYVAWRWRSSEEGIYGACGIEFDVDPNTGLTSLPGTPTSVQISHDLVDGVGGLLAQESGDEVTVVYADKGTAARTPDVCEHGSIATTWRSSTSIDHGKTWQFTGTIASASPPACIPVGQTAVQTSLRDFAFVRSGNALFAATPMDDNQGFSIFTSGNLGQTWEPLQDVRLSTAYTFYPALSADDRGRVALSFQAIETASDGSLLVRTWIAALPAGASSFVGPVPISGGYLADEPPPQGSCAHSLCTLGQGLSTNCDPLGCVASICSINPFCCDPEQLWTSDCAYMVGNLPDACQGIYSCGGRVLGDFASVATIPTGDIPGFNDTFMPTWSQDDFVQVPTPTGTTGVLQSNVAAALVQVTP
jgi:hypothetical protein